MVGVKKTLCVNLYGHKFENAIWPGGHEDSIFAYFGLSEPDGSVNRTPADPRPCPTAAALLVADATQNYSPSSESDSPYTDWRIHGRIRTHQNIIKTPQSRPSRRMVPQHCPSKWRLQARGGRRRKLYGRGLRGCRPRLRHSAASATRRRSPSTNHRPAAPGFRRF